MYSCNRKTAVKYTLVPEEIGLELSQSINQSK